MKRFLKQFLLFSILPVAVFLITSIIYADGFIDPFYLRFTTPKQQNLIIGTSRAAQGILPSVLKSNLNKDFYNYSFTVSHSPFGEAYYNSIIRKLNKRTKDGIFIISVDPFSITSHYDNDGKESFVNEKMIEKQMTVSMNPNIEFIIKNGLSPWRAIFSHHKIVKNEITFLHKDGWMEVKYPWTAEKYKTNLEVKMKDYRKNQMNRKRSSHRVYYLKKTIQSLQKYGKVYLVRIPTAKEMYDLENDLLPNFNYRIQEIADQYKVPYIDCSKDFSIYQTTDGNHLFHPSAKRFTQALCDSIVSSR
ncbi:MAG TPA: hypothetical protein PLI77_03900 [Bacteroidales bacterium]|nr:hypothetical protein [Bacteroidales bacterium]